MPFVEINSANAANTNPQQASAWYISAMEQLVDVVQKLSQARDIDAITAIVRAAARDLTGADGATFVLRDGDHCYYAEENAIAPLWKGKRFPMSICISGWVMMHGEPALIEDIYQDPRIPADAYRPTFVKSLAMVPVRRAAPIAAIGNYWATPHQPTAQEVAILQALADTTSVALENAELYHRLQQQVATLEEQQARISEQHTTLEVFTRALAHDLKEPVRTMMSFSQMIQDKTTAPEKRDTYFRYIQNAADRMGMLVNSVFEYTQLDDPGLMSKEPCAMQDVLSGVEENLAQLIAESGARITRDALPTVHANTTHMMQLMQNLISNAIRHNNANVTITIRAQEKHDRWLFSVHDNGVGVPADQLQTIFLPFKRLTHKEGCSGLGLATCQKIIHAHGEKIWCDSTPGEGAIFYFTLPKLQPAAQPAKTTATVLVVDDLEADIELTRIILNRSADMHYNVMVAHDGAEAHNVLKEYAGKENGIDFVLLDINMPGMNGLELLEKLRQDETLKDTSVIMCSGSTYERDRKRAHHLGAIGYLVKPPSPEKLSPLLAHIPTLHGPIHTPKSLTHAA